MKKIILAALVVFGILGMHQANAQSINTCETGVLVFTPINQTSGTTKTIVPGVAGKNLYICKLLLQTASANNVAVVEGTGVDCGTAVSAGLLGGTTASTGLNLPANGIVTLSGNQSGWSKTATAGDSICLITSASTNLSGTIVSVAQ